MIDKATALVCVVAFVALASGCSSKGDDGASASGPIPLPQSGSAAVAGPSPPKAICDAKTPDDHTCIELDDEELVREREGACAGTFAKSQACPKADIIGICRLPDGSLRYGYPPKTVTSQEKTCKELQGRFAAGAVPPPAEASKVASCEGKYDNACEEEVVHTSARLTALEEECRSFGGTYKLGAACGRDKARFGCDMKGKRTIVSRVFTTVEASKRFCEERQGTFIDMSGMVAATSASASPSASAPVDEDPPEPKSDVVIRQQ